VDACATATGKYKVDPFSSRRKRNVDEMHTTLFIVVGPFFELLCSEYKPRGADGHKCDWWASRAARGANNGIYLFAPWHGEKCKGLRA